MNPEAMYLQHYDRIRRIAAAVARKAHLNADEADEFAQVVCVRLLDDDYAIIRKFKGQSAFTTYLTTVIGRIYQGWRTTMWGKWRPSAEAIRLGDTAITLERLLTRDGFTLSEAVNILTTRSGAACTIAELEAIYVRLPPRNPRPVLVSDELLPETVAADGDADERLEARDRERTARVVTMTIDAAMQSMPAEDRLILRMRFWHARKVPDIARVLRLDQKKLYKRLDKLFDVLRHALEKAGVSRAEVARILVRGDQEIRLDLGLTEENPPLRPSHTTGEDVRGGEGRQP